MKIHKKHTHTELEFENDSIKDIIEKAKSYSSKFKKEHLIINLSEKINIKIEDFSLFLKLSKNRKALGTSFVLICNGIEIDDVPEELNVVPSLEEAVDVIEMEAIERDLGF